jgi:CubicO group peptidase (beta-lactamase class C family)
MNTRTITTLLTLALLTPLARADDTAPNLQPITRAIKPFVDNRELPGLVTLVTSKDKILHTSALGLSNIENNTAMKPDSIFWIASMTKPITAAAVLALEDDGKLSLHDPISKYIPELAGLKTREGQTPTITLAHILSHTSGMPEATNEQTKAAASPASTPPPALSRSSRASPSPTSSKPASSNPWA